MNKHIFRLRRGVRYVNENGETLLDQNGAPVRDDWSAYTSKPDSVKPFGGEMVIEYEENPATGKKIPRIKIGDGEHTFEDLEYMSIDSFILPKQSSVTLYGSEDPDYVGEDPWSEETDETGEFLGRYKQSVEVNNAIITKNSKVDLNPTPEQLAIFHEKDVAFVAENHGGAITVYCIGQKPKNTYLRIPVTVTEVLVDGKIIGNTTATPNPCPDWAQTDSAKADFIRNKPKVFAESEIVQLIKDNNQIDPNALNGVLKYTPQTLTEIEQEQARTNIGAVSNTDSKRLFESFAMYTTSALKFDGILGNKTVVKISQEDDLALYAVHIRNDVPSEDAMRGSCILGGMFNYDPSVLELQFEKQTEDGMFVAIPEGSTSNLISVLIIPYDLYKVDDVIFPKKGVYITSYYAVTDQFLIPLLHVSSLFLIDNVFCDQSNDTSNIISKTGGDTIVWNWGLDKPVIASVEEDVFILQVALVSDIVPAPSDIIGKPIAIGFVNNGVEFLSNVILSETDQDVTVKEDGYISIEDIIFIVPTDNYVIESGFVFPKRGIYFSRYIVNNTMLYTSSLKIYGFAGFSVLQKINTELMPSTIQRVGDDVIINSSTPGSTKKFKLTIDDMGTISATEVTS